MKYLLIDTCSWINLIGHEQENPQIEQLKYWIQKGLIEIIVPELIIQEWDEHKKNEKGRIHEHWKTKQKHFNEVLKRTGNISLEDTNVELGFIDKQINSINEIIQSSKNQITISDKIKQIIPDKTIKPQKAPFHHKDDSTKDAYIYFSTLEFCRNNNIKEIYFFSENSSDFGKPLPEKKGSKDEIHPDLLIDFPEIEVIYYGNIGWGIKELSKILPSPINNDVSSISKIEYNSIKIDTDLPVLDQVYEYLSIIHKEISFVPLNILKNNYPFKISDNSYPQYSHFSLSTDNNELTDFLECIQIEDGNVKLLDENYCLNIANYEDKISYIIKSLTQNLIFSIFNENTRKSTNVRLKKSGNCNCPKCNFRKFKFIESFNSLDSYSNTVEDLMEKAYLQYHFGNYVDASNTFKNVLNIAIESKLYTTAFISNYNLSKLSIFIRNNYWGENDQKDLAKELKQIDISLSAKKFGNNENKKIIEFIRDNIFYSDSRDKIQTIVSKIIDHYYIQLNGGWSYNNEIGELYNTYAEIETFLNHNYIIYDKFREFSDLSNVFFEGVFASHAIEKEENSRLESFDDWLIQQLLVYGDADTINKLFNRYKVKYLRYKTSTTNGESFDDLINNFLSINNSLRDDFLLVNEKGNRSFWQYYNKIFCNILTVVSICDFDEEYVESFTNKLLSYLEIENYIGPNSFKYIKIFFQRVGGKLRTETLNRFYILTLQNSLYHNEDFFDIISDILNERNEKLKLTKEQFEIVKNIAFEECEKCKEKHSNTIIIPNYNIIYNKKYRNEINQIITKTLNDSFDFDLFNLATLYDIIEFNQEYFDKALELAFPNSNQLSNRGFFAGINNNRFYKLNHIINLCFKYEIDTTKNDFDRFKEIDDYYCWLLNMNDFEYEKFKLSWIGEYSTRYYFKQFWKNNKLKQVIENLLKNNFNSEFERDYLNIYIRKTWLTKKRKTPNC